MPTLIQEEEYRHHHIVSYVPKIKIGIFQYHPNLCFFFTFHMNAYTQPDNIHLNYALYNIILRDQVPVIPLH